MFAMQYLLADALPNVCTVLQILIKKNNNKYFVSYQQIKIKNSPRE